MVLIPRSPLTGMPDVAILANAKAVHGDSYFPAAKSGDPLSAAALVQNHVGAAELALTQGFVGAGKPTLCPVHALETTGVNEIPLALAGAMSRRLGFTVETSIIQDNTVGHTGADGWHRLANPALFSGDVSARADYLIVDDFIGQGGTVANLAGFIGRTVGT
jgi:hypothetical protein